MLGVRFYVKVKGGRLRIKDERKIKGLNHRAGGGAPTIGGCDLVEGERLKGKGMF